MGCLVCPYCDRTVENPELMEVLGLTAQQEDLLWHIKYIANKLYGESFTHPEVQKWVKATTEGINDLLESYGSDPAVHRIK